MTSMVRLFVVMAAITNLLAAAQLPSSGCQELRGYRDNSTANLGYILRVDASDCCNICIDTPSCVGVSYAIKERTCYLKAALDLVEDGDWLILAASNPATPNVTSVTTTTAAPNVTAPPYEPNTTTAEPAPTTTTAWPPNPTVTETGIPPLPPATATPTPNATIPCGIGFCQAHEVCCGATNTSLTDGECYDPTVGKCCNGTAWYDVCDKDMTCYDTRNGVNGFCCFPNESPCAAENYGDCCWSDEICCAGSAGAACCFSDDSCAANGGSCVFRREIERELRRPPRPASSKRRH